MKKIIYSMIALAAVLMTSCTNDDIKIDINNRNNAVNLSISLTGLYSSYNYNDTRHNVKVSEDYRTFYSNHDHYIEVRTLIYNASGNLVDELLSYSTNINSVSQTVKLAEGTYTAVTTLTFAEKGNKDGEYYYYWTVADKETLANAKLQSKYRFSKWSIMSYASKRFSIEEGKTVSLAMSPTPVGALCYGFYQNFQYESEATYGTLADNGIRSLTVYAQTVAEAYRLDPNATEKFIYKDELKTGTWYWLSNFLEPADFDEDWTFFRSNLYTYFYILQPNIHIQFGYIPEGETGFYGYGDNSYTLTSGQMYLAYWDYFQIGNPYFGVADNNHWNSYESSAKKREGKAASDAVSAITTKNAR